LLARGISSEHKGDSVRRSPPKTRRYNWREMKKPAYSFFFEKSFSGRRWSIPESNAENAEIFDFLSFSCMLDP